MALVPEVVDAVSVPVAAAGGIVDGRGLVAALALGASGVLMGSRFLLTRESIAPEAHKKRILEQRGDETIVTDTISGRYARVLRNDLTEGYHLSGAPVLPFPSQLLASADVRAAAEQQDDADHLPLWCSQAAGRLQDLPWAADVVRDTITEAIALLAHGLPTRVRRG
jgi:nitronate monooxygenase